MTVFPVYFECAVSAKDFRSATYFILLKRYAAFFRGLTITCVLTVVYFLFSLLGLSFAVAIQPMLLFILFTITFITALFVVQTEHGIRRYLRSKNNLIDCTCAVSFEEKAVRMTIPERSFQKTYTLEKFACVFESSSLLLLYVSETDLHIIPKRYIAADELAALRAHLRRHLNKSFVSKY